MEPYIAVTNPSWFQHLRAQADGQGRLDEVNFWNPSGKTLKNFTPGTPIFFRLKAPYKCIAGYGFFAVFHPMRLDLAWDCFGPKNGADDSYALSTLTQKEKHAVIGCTVLRNVILWPENRWLPWQADQDWAKAGPQRGKTERNLHLASKLIDEIHYDSLYAPEEIVDAFTLVDVDEREVAQAKVKPRLGQGTFRTRLLQAYDGRCAITGEHTEIVLDAAHIQPYLGPQSNHIRNGLLLTKEFHTLFDAGYVTITPEYKVRVSPRLHADWDNGHRYYAVDGQQLLVLPQQEALCPQPEVLAWHGQRRFLAG